MLHEILEAVLEKNIAFKTINNQVVLYKKSVTNQFQKSNDINNKIKVFNIIGTLNY